MPFEADSAIGEEEEKGGVEEGGRPLIAHVAYHRTRSAVERYSWECLWAEIK